MQQLLRTYIPIDRYAALAAGHDLPDRARGAALFADISGFTPLTAALAREYGPFRGAEEMTSNISRIYEVLVAETHRFSGSVVSFCGDAIICWFDDQGAGVGSWGIADEAPTMYPQFPAPAALRAAACGLAMQQAILPHTAIAVPSGAAFTVAIKVMIAGGAVRRFLPGDSAIRRIDVLAGGAITIAAAANSSARAGEVLLDEAAAAALGASAEIAEWRADSQIGRRFAVLSKLHSAAAPAAWPEPAVLVDEAMARAWLWPAVYERLRQGSDQLISELRPTVALFLAFEGIDYDGDDAAGAQLDALIRHVQQVLVAYEGALMELTIGDKGSYLYAAFGAPLAHVDDAARAIAAAMDLCRLPSELAFIGAVRIGIAHGQSYTGIYGATSRRTYGVQGDKVNLAARLMEHADPWTICCDADAARRASARWLFDELAPIHVKGKPEPIAIFRPIGPRRQSARPAAPRDAIRPLVGRAVEIEQLVGALAQLDQGSCRVLWIEGEPGIGKSRLVEELARLAGERGLAPLAGAGASTEQGAPYRAWSEIFAGLFGLGDIADSDQRLARVGQELNRLAPDHIARLPLLNDLLHLGAPETALTAGLDPPLRQESLLQLASALLRAHGWARPLVLILEDAQWLDSLSWALAAYVARAFAAAGAPLLLAVVARPIDDAEPNAELAAAVRALEWSDTLSLTTLEPEETVALAAARLGLPPNGLPEPVAEIVRRRAGGNPFFAEELVLALRDIRMLAIEEGQAGGEPRCVLVGDLAAAGEALPATLHELVLSRIDRLPPDRQLVLKVAAVIGRTFAYMPLHWALGAYTTTTSELLRAQLADLARLNMTVLDALEPDLTYVFKHIITRDAAYQTLLFAQRKQIHRLVAEWYEHTYVGDGAQAGAGVAQPPLALFSTLLAYHYQQAEDAARERVYAQLAGEQAAARYANPEAIGYLGRALELTPDDDYAARYALLLAREKVYDLQGARDLQRDDLDALAALAEALSDDRRRAEIALRRSVFANMVGDIPAALQAAERCVALAQASGRRDLEAEGNQLWGWVLWTQGLSGARAYFERALALARDAGIADAEARSLAALGNAAWLEGDFDAAAVRYAQALPLYRAAGDRRGESTTIMNIGIVDQARGDYASARGHYEQALRLKRELGDRRNESKVLSALGTLYTDLGLYDVARDNYRQALQISREIGGRVGECEILTLRAELMNFRAAYAEARSEAEQAADIAQETGSRDDYARALLPLADAQAALGNLDAAENGYRQALAIWQDLGLANMLPQPRAGLARLALARGDIPQALEYVAQLIGRWPAELPQNADELLPVALTCYRVLHAAGDARAAALLRAAHAALQTRAARIDDPELRRSFLDHVIAHRAIAEAHQALTVVP